jgi:site-specific recombinase XerD
MLSEFFKSPHRIQQIRGGPSGALLEDFAAYLFQSGYAEISARRHIRSAEHLVHWAVRRHLSLRDLDESALQNFGDHLIRCHCGRFWRTNRVDILTGARLFLRHVHNSNGRAIVTSPASSEPRLFQLFRAWMRAQRGTSDQTLYNYGLPIRELIRRFGNNLSKLDAHRLRQFVLKQGSTSGWAKTQKCTTALRMFLRFLIAEGRCRAGLVSAIPVLAHWRLTSLPRYLPTEDVERLITSCDLSSPVGKRDRAILLLLARLGLRAGDIVQLRVQDIDWKDAWILVSGKSRREVRLPLTQEVGQAIVTYLRHGRPQARTDTLFVRSRAPFVGFASHCAVSVLVDRAIRRAKVTRPSRGAAHLLRHSLASSMLRHGASLQDISVLLRHRSIETTQIYAKVDVAGLGQIAQPWPEVSSC